MQILCTVMNYFMNLLHIFPWSSNFQFLYTDFYISCDQDVSEFSSFVPNIESRQNEGPLGWEEELENHPSLLSVSSSGLAQGSAQHPRSRLIG